MMAATVSWRQGTEYMEGYTAELRKHLLCVSKVASVADLPKPKFEKLFVQAMLKMPVLKDVNADLHEIEQVPPLVLAPL